MSLLSKEKALIKKDYFQVWEIVEMLSKDGYNLWDEVGAFLGHHDFDTELTLYCRDSFHRMHEVRNNYSPIRNLIERLSVVWLEGEESIRKIKLDVIDYYWAKHEIYNFKPLIELDIIPLSTPLEPNIECGEQNTQSNIAPTKNIDFSKLYLYKSPLLTLHEAACIISNHDPEAVDRCRNDTNFSQYFAQYLRALSFLDACVGAGEIAIDFSTGSTIEALQLKSYLASENIIIDGFNDDLQGAELEKNTDANNTELQQLKQENEKLKAEIEKLKQAQIQQEPNSEIEAPLLVGLDKINQLAQDRQAMARIMAVYLWEQEEHKDKLPKDIALLVMKEMRNYCADGDIPQTTETMKRIISSVTPEHAKNKRGRPLKKTMP